MPNIYSLDLRKKVMNFIFQGNKQVSAAKLFGIGKTTIYRWCKEYKEKGEVKLPPPPQKKGYKLCHNEILQYVLQNSDKTLKEIAAKFGTWPRAIVHILNKNKITRKKKPFVQRKEPSNKKNLSSETSKYRSVKISLC